MGKQKCTDELIENAVKHKKTGMNNKDLCNVLGIGETTFYRWLSNPATDKQRELGESLKNAEAEYFEALRVKIILASDDDWRAAAWMLERLRPDEYGRRERHEVRAEIAPEDPLAGIDDPEIRDHVKAILKKRYG